MKDASFTVIIIVTSLLFGAMLNSFDTRDNCATKGISKLLIYNTTISCTVNVEK